MKKTLITLCGACLLFAGAATAQPGPGGGAPLVGERFNAADTDGDGALSYAEITAVRPGMPQDAFNRLDANGDGKLTPDELARGMREFRERRGEPGERPGRGPGGPGSPGGPGGPGFRPDPQMMLKEADTDGDGKVTLEEFKAHAVKKAEEHFKRMDRNSDGVITQDEIPQHGPGGPGAPGGGPHGPRGGGGDGSGPKGTKSGPGNAPDTQQKQ